MLLAQDASPTPNPYQIMDERLYFDLLVDNSGSETTLDYKRLLQIVKDNNYSGYIGIEYEGTRLPEAQGIQLTRELLISAGKQLQS